MCCHFWHWMVRQCMMNMCDTQSGLGCSLWYEIFQSDDCRHRTTMVNFVKKIVSLCEHYLLLVLQVIAHMWRWSLAGWQCQRRQVLHLVWNSSPRSRTSMEGWLLAIPGPWQMRFSSNLGPVKLELYGVCSLNLVDICYQVCNVHRIHPM